MVTELEMACHMWDVYTKNVVRFGRVEIKLNSAIKIVNYDNLVGETVICEFGRFADESDFIRYVIDDVRKLGGEAVIKWGERK